MVVYLVPLVCGCSGLGLVGWWGLFSFVGLLVSDFWIWACGWWFCGLCAVLGGVGLVVILVGF